MEGIAHVPTASRATDAFELSMGEHYPGLVRRLTAILRDADAAADIAQEAYLRAFRSWDRFDGTDPRAWLHTIGVRLAFNERRRRYRWAWLRTTGVSTTAPEPADLDLHQALRALRPEHRAALLLSVVDGYTQSEIAAMLDVAPGTVASWLSRAKSHLRETMSDA